jgi:hypothetical protein
MWSCYRLQAALACNSSVLRHIAANFPDKLFHSTKVPTVPEFWIQFEPLGGTNLLNKVEGGYWSGLNVLHVLATLQPETFDNPKEQVNAFAAVLEGAAGADGGASQLSGTTCLPKSNVHMLLSQPADLNRSEQFVYRNITVTHMLILMKSSLSFTSGGYFHLRNSEQEIFGTFQRGAFNAILNSVGGASSLAQLETTLCAAAYSARRKEQVDTDDFASEWSMLSKSGDETNIAEFRNNSLFELAVKYTAEPAVVSALLLCQHPHTIDRAALLLWHDNTCNLCNTGSPYYEEDPRCTCQSQRRISHTLLFCHSWHALRVLCLAERADPDSTCMITTLPLELLNLIGHLMMKVMWREASEKALVLDTRDAGSRPSMVYSKRWGRFLL